MCALFVNCDENNHDALRPIIDQGWSAGEVLEQSFCQGLGHTTLLDLKNKCHFDSHKVQPTGILGGTDLNRPSLVIWSPFFFFWRVVYVMCDARWGDNFPKKKVLHHDAKTS